MMIEEVQLYVALHLLGCIIYELACLKTEINTFNEKY
jgi:hypothetical protein